MGVFAALLLGWMVWLYAADPSAADAGIPCPFHAVTGLDCPGCGLQRAVHALLHGRFVEAFHHNMLSPLLLPLTAWALLASFVPVLPARARRVLRIGEPGVRRRTIPTPAVIAAVVVVLLYWVMRNI